MELDIYIIDNIISFLNINNKIFINKKYYKISKCEIKTKINKISIFYKYHKLRLEMLFEYDSFTHNNWIYNYYILFYPTELRILLMYNALNYLNTINRPYIYKLYYLANKYPNKKKYFFKYFIKLLNINELHYLGW